MVLLPDKFREKYELLFGVRCQAQLGIYPFFNASGRFNVESLRQALASWAGTRKTILILSFPTDSTGYAVTPSEVQQVVSFLAEAAQDGRNLVVVTDDACLGPPRRENGRQESLFAGLADLHERILALKIDGPMQEESVRGLHAGMLTFSSRAFFSEEALYGALEKKAAGAIRSAG